MLFNFVQVLLSISAWWLLSGTLRSELNQLKVERHVNGLQSELEGSVGCLCYKLGLFYLLSRGDAHVLIHFHSQFQLVCNYCCNFCELVGLPRSLARRQVWHSREEIPAPSVFRKSIGLCRNLSNHVWWPTHRVLFKSVVYHFHALFICLNLWLFLDHRHEVWKWCRDKELRDCWHNNGHTP